MPQRKIRPAADPKSLQERQALERRIVGVTQARDAAQAHDHEQKAARLTALLEIMQGCLDRGERFYALHGSRPQPQDDDS